jgi:hypothetical protein
MGLISWLMLFLSPWGLEVSIWVFVFFIFLYLGSLHFFISFCLFISRAFSFVALYTVSEWKIKKGIVAGIFFLIGWPLDMEQEGLIHLLFVHILLKESMSRLQVKNILMEILAMSFAMHRGRFDWTIVIW